MCHVYILASRNHGTSYIGVTNSLRTRLDQHRRGDGSTFVRQYGVDRLVYVETYQRPDEAIAREKQLKCWNRDGKFRLIQENNPDWNDLRVFPLSMESVRAGLHLSPLGRGRSRRLRVRGIKHH